MKTINCNVLITGASSGIGRALAVECAKRGAQRIFLCGRDCGRLHSVSEECSRFGAVVRGDVVDVTDEISSREWIHSCEAEAPLELIFSNAGISTGEESEQNVRRTFATNVGGGLNVVLPAIELFRRTTPRRRKQIVITASIAGYAPLSTCPAYAGSKAAMKNWGLSLRGMLRREGIKVNVVCPGFVRSRITDMNTCPMPFFMEADKAASIILNRVERDVGLIAFPWPMRFSAWWLSTLPWHIAEIIAGFLPEKAGK